MKNKIIGILLNKENEFVSGEDLSKLLGISRAGIWKHIKNLKSEGYKIESVNRKGYRFLKVAPKQQNTNAEECYVFA